MQTKVTMIKSVVSAIDSGTLTEKDEILAYVDEMVRRGADKAVSMKDANSGRYASLMKGNQKGKIILDYKGGFKFATSYISEVTGWRIVGIKPLHKLLLFLLMIVLVNVGLCLIIVQITRRISNNRISVLFAPLESISQKVLKIAEGNLDITFDEEQNSVEITNLTNSLNDTIQSLKYYMESIANTVTAISNKDLTASIDGEFKGSYIKIKESLGHIMDGLNESFGTIQEQAESVLCFSDDLMQTTENVASSASMQNQAVAEVSNDVLLITDQTREITKCAATVRENADITNQHLEESIQEIQSLVKAMESINACYEEIASFVDEIRNLADQTNLLALNASIEAARAGEVGSCYSDNQSEYQRNCRNGRE